MPQWIGSPFRDHFVYMPSQWEIMLHCNVVSHWPGSYSKWSLHHCFRFWFVPTTWNNADSLLSKRCFGSNLSKIWIKIKICMKENAFKDAICKMLTILFRPQQVMKLGCPGCQEASANIMLTQVWFPFYSCLAYHILCQQWFHCWQYSLKKAPVCDSWFFSMSCSGGAGGEWPTLGWLLGNSQGWAGKPLAQIPQVTIEHQTGNKGLSGTGGDPIVVHHWQHMTWQHPAWMALHLISASHYIEDRHHQTLERPERMAYDRLSMTSLQGTDNKKYPRTAVLLKLTYIDSHFSLC